MRVAACLLLLASGIPLSLACGGGTPAPKNEDEVASGSKSDEAKSESAKPDDGTAAAAASDTPAAAPAETAAAAPPSKANDSSGDIKVPDKNDPWMASHQVPEGDVKKTMKAQMGKVNACYKTAKKKDPSVTGEVKIKFVITNDGVVRDWKDDSSTMSDEDVTKCVGEIVKKLKFPKQKSPGDAWGGYHINFTP
jgi:hypothetical protein